jgi:threonine/homoserine/homoserine lactone efflux protein
MLSLLQQILTGSVLGLSAGLAPGPMLALVLSQTLRYSTAEGVKTSLAPLVTDPPIILACLLLYLQIAEVEPAIGVLSLFGAGYLVYLGWETARATCRDLEDPPGAPRSLFKGIVTNILNPHPYMFWFSVGAPLLLEPGPARALLFLAFFYACLVGSKCVLALLAGRGKTLLRTGVYPWIMRFLGAALFICAAVFADNGIRLLL